MLCLHVNALLAQREFIKAVHQGQKENSEAKTVRKAMETTSLSSQDMAWIVQHKVITSMTLTKLSAASRSHTWQRMT